MTGFVLDMANFAGSRWAVWITASLLESAALLAIVSLLWLMIRTRVSPQLGYILFLLVPLKLLFPISLSAPPEIARWTPTTLASSWLGATPAHSNRTTPSIEPAT